ncbi:MAG TPA: hypothetical protein VFV08_11590 [Puia sp.]|nr:hypothetical protein [Puia sp.]
MSIADEYEFLREHIPIYYHPGSLMPASHIRAYTRRYTPDFLIRHKITGEASLVEIKPRAFEGNKQLEIRRAVAENYIRWKKYDWTFKVIFNDQIKLNEKEQSAFDDCRRLILDPSNNHDTSNFKVRFSQSVSSSLCGAPSASRVQFVMFGPVPVVRN